MGEIYSFGEWVRRRRRALDITQEQLADRVGCSKVLISKIETDSRRPSREIAQLLAAALGLPEGEQAAFVAAARAEQTVDSLPTPALALAAGSPQAAPPRPARAAVEEMPPLAPRMAPADASVAAVPRLWLWWGAAMAAGVGVGRLLGWLVGRALYADGQVDLGGGAALFGAGLALAADTIALGATLAAAQYAVLRRHSAARWWAAGTLLAWALAGPPTRIVGGLLGGALVGAAMGLAQGLAAWRPRRAALWAAASAACWAPLWAAAGELNAAIYRSIGGTMAESAYQRGAGWAIALLVAGAIVGGGIGLVSGAVLARMLPAGTPAAAPRRHIS